MDNNNLPPFYVGQKVICIDDSDTPELKKGQQYTVTMITRANCNCKGYFINVNNLLDYYNNTGARIFKGDIGLCCSCNTKCICSGYADFEPSRFAPIQEQSYPLIKLSKVCEEVTISAN